jgi:hypothetical protein
MNLKSIPNTKKALVAAKLYELEINPVARLLETLFNSKSLSERKLSDSEPKPGKAIFTTANSIGPEGPSKEVLINYYRKQTSMFWTCDPERFQVPRRGYQQVTINTSGIYEVKAYGAGTTACLGAIATGKFYFYLDLGVKDLTIFIKGVVVVK